MVPSIDRVVRMLTSLRAGCRNRVTYKGILSHYLGLTSSFMPEFDSLTERQVMTVLNADSGRSSNTR